VLRWFGVSASSGVTLVHSEEELKMLVTASREKGVLEEEEQEMLHKVFEFADKDAVDVMVPRPDVVAVPVDLPVQEVLRLVLSHPFTRYPVFAEEIDDIVGVLHVRDLFSALHERGLESTDLRTILREAIMVPETKPLDELLAEFQRTSNHLAIVVDEYGSVEGLVTLEDLLEEIVGEIGDEFDLPDAGILRIGRGRVRLVGSFPIEEFNERFGKGLPVDDYHTIGGFVFGALGRVPKVGDTVAFDGATFEVSAIDGPRIREVDVTLATAAPQPARPPGQSE
jgi:CBS domain containing-hemolysin-like protein